MTRLGLWFTLAGPVDRRTYFVNGFGLMAFKYAVDSAAVWLATGRFWSPLDYLLPLYALRAAKLAGAPPWFLPAFVVWALPFMWIGVAMTLRRAVDAGRSPWLSLGFFVPLLNYALMLALCALPSAPLRRWEDAAGARIVDARLAAGLYGIAAGLAVAIPTIVLNVYLLRRYSTSLFLGTPFTLGAVTAYVLNRAAPRGVGVTMQVVGLSMGLLAGAILLFGLEGLVCIALALPIALAIALLGGVLGRVIALHAPGRPLHAAGLVLALPLPLLAGVDRLRGPGRARAVVDAVVIEAPPDAVWRHVVSFSALAPPTEPLFRLGVATPGAPASWGRAGRGALLRVLHRYVRRADHVVGRAPAPRLRHHTPARAAARALATRRDRAAPSRRLLPGAPRRVSAGRPAKRAHAAGREHGVRARHRAGLVLAAVRRRDGVSHSPESVASHQNGWLKAVVRYP